MSELSINGKLISNTDIVEDGVEYKTGATFNGKPVYRRTFYKDSYTAGAGTISDVEVGAISNYDAVIHIYGTATEAGNNIEIPYIAGLGGGTSYLWSFTVWITSGTGKITAQIATLTGHAPTFTDIIVSVEYTKTTD